ncbi:hypothetical protein K501DRAFT_219418 [Backusella circina FSU 941]|nr:hypothetical protein K501DRAFT_219418 [Backusella circina FSU 941]
MEEREPIYCDSCTSYFRTVQLYEAHYEAQHRNVCLECLKVFPAFRWLQLHLDEAHDILKQIRKERGEKIFACFVEGCTKHFSSPKMRKLHLIDKHSYSKHFPFDITFTGSLSFEQRKRRIQKKKRLAAEHYGLSSNNNSNSNDDVVMNELVSNMSKLRIPKSISFGHAKPSIQRHQYNLRSATTTRNVNMTDQEEEEEEEKKIYLRPRKRGPKKKRQAMDIDAEQKE